MVSNHDQFLSVILYCASDTLFNYLLLNTTTFSRSNSFFYTLTDGREYTSQKFLLSEEQPWWHIELAIKGEPSELADLPLYT